MVVHTISTRKLLAVSAAFLFTANLAAAQAPPAGKQPETVPAAPAETPGLTTTKEKFSYGIGRNLGAELRQQGIADDVDAQALVRGISDALSGAKLAVSPEELQKAMTEMSQEIAARQKSLGEKNKKEGEAFLAENKTKEGVETMPSGLQYKVVKSGKGATPGPTDLVKAHYHGTLIDGTVFDSSVARGEPAEFPVNGVIKGWSEALQKMKVGDKWKLYVPSELAYREQSRGEDIGPNSTLIFEIELLDVKKQPTGIQLPQ